MPGYSEVTDPALLAQLNAPVAAAPSSGGAMVPVTDQALLAQLNAPSSDAPKDEGATWGQRFAHGLGDPIYGVGQLIRHGFSALPHLEGKPYQRPDGTMNMDPNPGEYEADDAQTLKAVDDEVKSRKTAYDERLTAAGRDPKDYTDWAGLAGNVASPVGMIPASRAASLISPATTIVARGAATGLGQAVARTGARGALGGAANAATQPVTDEGDYGDQKAGQIATGAVVGGGLNAGAGLASKAIAGAVSDSAARRLVDQGVKTTVGQTLGGWARHIENAMGSYLPLIDHQVSDLQGESVNSWNRTRVNAALGRIGEKLPESVPTGTDAIDHAAKTIGDAYQNALTGASTGIDATLHSQFRTLSKQAFENLPKDEFDKFNQIIEGIRYKHANASDGNIDGEAIKRLDASLGNDARSRLKSSDPDKQDLGRYIREAQDFYRGAISRQNPSTEGPLANANRAYAEFLPLAKAAEKATGTGGVFTPNQVLITTRTGARNGLEFARGQSINQAAAQDAQEVLPNTVRNSGSPAGIAYGNAIHRALTVGLAATVPPPMAIAGSLAMGAFTPAGQNAGRWLAAGSPVSRAMIANAITEKVPTFPLTRAITQQNQDQ